ncbi:MAG: hypothetical protein ACYDHW_06985 [Syntrophorhabdaceae bacterium]
MSLIRSNFAEFYRDLQHSTQAIDKAAKSAASTVAFDMKKQLEKDIKAGNIAGQKMKPLREISKNKAVKSRFFAKGGGEYGTIPYSKPLWLLHKVVRYNVREQRDTLFHYEIGFVSPAKAPISRNWIDIARRQQTGERFAVSAAMRKKLAQIGSSMSKRNWRRNLFFIKTQDFTLPSRDIIDSFMMTHQQKAIALMRQRFEQILSGAWKRRGAGSTDTSWMKVNA